MSVLLLLQAEVGVQTRIAPPLTRAGATRGSRRVSRTAVLADYAGSLRRRSGRRQQIADLSGKLASDSSTNWLGRVDNHLA